MKLIVGLGNPGRKYRKTRHNIGFMFIDSLVQELNLKFRLDSKFQGEVIDTKINNETVVFLKPSTYMNLSGIAINKVIKYYNIDIKDIIVIYDDNALEIGKVRIREKGSSGGHNGLKSIIKELGTDQFKRIRLGIGKNTYIDNKDYVLGKVKSKDMKVYNEIFYEAKNMVNLFVTEDFNQLMNLYSS